MKARFIALALFATVAIGQLGCSSDDATVNASDDSFTTLAGGLWALDGEAEHGDIELLQLDQRSFASVSHVDEAPIAQAAPQGAAAAPHAHAAAARAAAPPADQTATGNLTRARRAASTQVSIVVDGVKYAVTEHGDTLKLTSADGRVLTYRRSYRLYCVPDDRGVEATMLLEIGKEPKVVGVNGDGVTFPAEGTYDAAVRDDVLFRLMEYVITSDVGASSVTVKLPWEDMSKAKIKGSISIVGPANAAAPTKISCERVQPTP